MPEYLAPGTYVEEISFRSKAIEGVSTGITAFVGPTLQGPVLDPDKSALPEVLTGVAEFERVYGGSGDLAVGGSTATNYVAHAVRAFFENGGARLYVVRVPTQAAGATGSALPGGDAYAKALRVAGKLKGVSMVAAPGYSADAVNGPVIQQALIAHAEQPGTYRVAILDAPRDASPSQMHAARGKIDSNHAAIYYPWVVASNAQPGSNEPADVELDLPPSGFVCGVYARVGVAGGSWRAPTNESVRGALRFARDVTFAEQNLLTSTGVNCLRDLPNRGYCIWGARSVSSDPAWKYISARRYCNYLEASIDHGTQWAVFEANDERLWANLRNTIDDFLLVQWRNGALAGTKPEQAYFVRCDRTTMTQTDIDNGRVTCMIGIALLKPAEFVILRIAQMTADAR